MGPVLDKGRVVIQNIPRSLVECPAAGSATQSPLARLHFPMAEARGFNGLGPGARSPPALSLSSPVLPLFAGAASLLPQRTQPLARPSSINGSQSKHIGLLWSLLLIAVRFLFITCLFNLIHGCETQGLLEGQIQHGRPAGQMVLALQSPTMGIAEPLVSYITTANSSKFVLFLTSLATSDWLPPWQDERQRQQ